MIRNHNSVYNFENLPYRIFLDSNILQNLQKYGEYIWDNVDILDNIKEIRNITALHDIFSLNFGSSFEFVLSENSIKEVSNKNDKSYLQRAFDVLDHWMSCIYEYENKEAFSGEGKKLLEKLNEKNFIT